MREGWRRAGRGTNEGARFLATAGPWNQSAGSRSQGTSETCAAIRRLSPDPEKGPSLFSRCFPSVYSPQCLAPDARFRPGFYHALICRNRRRRIFHKPAHSRRSARALSDTQSLGIRWAAAHELGRRHAAAAHIIAHPGGIRSAAAEKSDGPLFHSGPRKGAITLFSMFSLSVLPPMPRTGQPLQAGALEAGKQVGRWRRYYDNGRLIDEGMRLCKRSDAAALLAPVAVVLGADPSKRHPTRQ